MEKEVILVGNIHVFGVGLNKYTGCIHHHSTVDIVAIKFRCCNLYYACYLCHQAISQHVSEKWQRKDFKCASILCGRCGWELTIEEYMDCESCCTQCGALFNRGCQNHWHLYFEV